MTEDRLLSRRKFSISAAAAVIAGIASPLLPAAHARALGDDYPWRGQGVSAGFSVWHINGRPDNPATGYYWRNCTDFVADRIFRTTGQRIPRAMGNAVVWGPVARQHGFAVDGNPRVGSVAWFNNSTWGHVGWVAEVRGDGSVLVENYNNASANGAYFQSVHRRGANWPAGFIHFFNYSTGPQPIAEGSFVSYGGHVYRIAGGAPIYVSTWDRFGGVQHTRALSAAEFNGLRRVPVDGTLISGQAPGHPENGTVYVIAGGAPLYISSFNRRAADRPIIGVDLAAIHRAGQSDMWSHLNYYPADGTLVSGQAPGDPENGTVYVIAGGAPVYISSFNHVGAGRPIVNVDLAAVHNAGKPGRWSHLNFTPAEGTLISAQAPGSGDHGTVYVIAGGAPVYISTFNHVGAGRPIVNVDLAAVHNAGNAGRWSHLNRTPVDGTLISGQAPGKPDHGTVYRVAGGAPIYVYSWAGIGGEKRPVNVDLVAVQNAGKEGRWRFLRNLPANGTVLLGHSSGKYYRVQDGRPVHISSPAAADKAKAVPVDQTAIDRAGQRLTHLRAPAQPPKPTTQPKPTQPKPTTPPKPKPTPKPPTPKPPAPKPGTPAGGGGSSFGS